MEGFKFIKAVYLNEKKIIGVCFSGTQNYQDFLKEAKRVFNISEDVCIFSNGFLIETEIFSNFVAQFVANPDFVIEIQSTGAISVTSNSTLDICENTNEKNDVVCMSQTPIVDSFLCESNSGLIFEDNIILNEPFLSVLPGTEQIKEIPIIKNFCNSGIISLENKERTQIAKAVIFNILNNNPNRRLLRDDFFKLTKSILDIFPSEVSATYYVPFSKGHLAKGKLYDAYNNAKVKLSASGVINRRKNAKPEIEKGTESSSTSTNKDCEFFTEVLKTGNGEWEIIKESWKITHFLRKTELKNGEFKTFNYFEKYKVLENEKSYELFSIDFKILYPNSKSIYEWKFFYEKVIERARKLKENAVREILAQILKTEDEDLKLALSLMLVPYLLPTSRSKSKIEVQELFISYCKNILVADNNIRSAIKRTELEAQPKIYFVGDSSKSVCLAYVDVCGVRIKVNNSLHAVEICFHCYMAINIKYPKFCNHVWLFIQKLIFCIETEWDPEIPAVNTLINDLKK